MTCVSVVCLVALAQGAGHGRECELHGVACVAWVRHGMCRMGVGQRVGAKGAANGFAGLGLPWPVPGLIRTAPKECGSLACATYAPQKDVRRALMRQVGDGWSGGDDSDSESNMSVSVHPFGNLRWSGEGEEAGRRLSGNMIRRSSSQLVSKSGNSGEGAALLRLDAPETYTSMASALAAILSDRDFSGRAAELAAAAGQQPPPRPSQNGGHGLTVKFAPESFVSPSGPSNTTAMEAHVAAAGAMKHLLRTRSSLVRGVRFQWLEQDG